MPAQKNISSIPMQFFVAIYAAEGLVEWKKGELVAEIKKAASDPSYADWEEIKELRIALFNYTKQLTQAIMAIESYMERG